MIKIADTIFDNITIFDYQNIHLLYGPIWKNLDLKGHRNGYRKNIGRPDLIIPAPELTERPEGKEHNIFIMLAQSLDQRKA